MAAKPIADTIWRGSFMISRPKMSLSLKAHLSSKACTKVWLAAKDMAEVLCPEFFPRLDVWPKSFKSSRLIDDNIAIYFFSVKGRDDQVFDNLLYNLEHYDIALKAVVGDSELLIFPSSHLPEKHQRFDGKLYLWGVFCGTQTPQHSSDDCFIHNTQVAQTSTPNLANDVVPGKDISCKEFSNKKDPSPSSKTARKGRPLDDAWQHATPVDGKKQRTVCKYCGYISSSGGITYLKAHLGGGDPMGSLKGCPNVPPEVKRVMADWLKGTIRGGKGPQLEEIRTDFEEAVASKKSVRRGRPLDIAWEHATPLDAKRQRAACKYCNFISSSGGITHLKAHLAGGDPKGPRGCPNVPPEIKRVMAESLNRTVKGVKEVKAMQPEEIRRYLKAENDWSPPNSDTYSFSQQRIMKNGQNSNLAGGGYSLKNMNMSKQEERECVDNCMEVLSSHNVCKSSFLSKPTTRIGFI